MFLQKPYEKYGFWFANYIHILLRVFCVQVQKQTSNNDLLWEQYYQRKVHSFNFNS